METPPEAPTPPEQPPAETAEVDPTPDLIDPPADVADEFSTGHAVFDRTVGQFVGPVTSAKPSRSDAAKRAPGHTVAIVRV